MALRVTHIFRKEDGAWKLILRHADPLVAKTAPASVWKSVRRFAESGYASDRRGPAGNGGAVISIPTDVEEDRCSGLGDS